MTLNCDNSLIITKENSASPVALQLVLEFFQEIAEIYQDDVLGDPQPELFQVPGSFFLIAWKDKKPVGCGAFRPFSEESAEFKRIFVIKEARNQGIARQILSELERHAGECGYLSICLETGILQPDAIHLYEKLNYHRIPPFGKFADHPSCVCFGKKL